MLHIRQNWASTHKPPCASSIDSKYTRSTQSILTLVKMECVLLNFQIWYLQCWRYAMPIDNFHEISISSLLGHMYIIDPLLQDDTWLPMLCPWSRLWWLWSCLWLTHFFVFPGHVLVILELIVVFVFFRVYLETTNWHALLTKPCTDTIWYHISTIQDNSVSRTWCPQTIGAHTWTTTDHGWWWSDMVLWASNSAWDAIIATSVKNIELQLHLHTQEHIVSMKNKTMKWWHQPYNVMKLNCAWNTIGEKYTKPTKNTY